MKRKTTLIFGCWTIFLLISLANAKRNSGKHVVLEDGTSGDSKREGKVFSLFNVVRFSNVACTTISNTGQAAGTGNQAGTCYSAAQCSGLGGVASGSCASGFGVCCLFVVSATGSAITQNCSYIQSPGFPTALTTATAITYTVNKFCPTVCSLRLDFVSFTIQGVGGTADVNFAAANAIRTCKDTLTVTSTGGKTNIPIICGVNTGQHIYVELGANTGDTATLSFAFAAAAAVAAGAAAAPVPTRLWNFKATQYNCGDRNAAPEGCLQYQTQQTGIIKTFNYDTTTDNHLPNQQYSVCIRANKGFCCVQYEVCPTSIGAATGTNLPWSLSGANNPINAAFDGICNGQDYIGIADSSSTCSEGLANFGLRSRYCGALFNDVSIKASLSQNAPICDCTPPFSVEVFTNNIGDAPTNPATGGVVQNILSQGVCLTYQQLPCTG